MILHNFWIDPMGKIIPVSVAGHDSYVERKFPMLCKTKKKHESPSDLLCAKGWRKVSDWGGPGAPMLSHKKISNMQREAIERYERENFTKIHIPNVD